VQIDTSGLAIVIIDALTAYQWVKEDDLAAKLGINQKTMRRAVVYLADVGTA
jgi:transcription initiation factor IIE alpha subunit